MPSSFSTGRTAPFRFAVIADTHINPSDNDHISPFESHRLTNARMLHTVDILNALEPDLVVHVGDMVHPVPEAVTYPVAAARFKETVAGLKAPLHCVPGNHDIGDKLADYVPAGGIRDTYIDLYRVHFGADYHAFEAGGCAFIVINTSLINSGFEQEAVQARWLEDQLNHFRTKRVFVCMHYPPFIASDDEAGHYDNLDQPGRQWFVDLIRKHRVAGVFTGHVHNFFYNRIGETPVFSMPSTAFVRGDYSELFSIGQPPEHENGRNDVAKLAVLVVDVYPDRIVPQFIRTHDRNEAKDAPAPQRDWPSLPPAGGSCARLGIDLRYSWTELHEIPYSSMLDEFQRKLARNDYPVLALWEMGIGHLRVPIDDLLKSRTRERMLALAAQGAHFTVFLFGWPDANAIECMAEHRHMLQAVEIILKWPLPADAVQRISRLTAQAGIPVHLSRFWSASGHSKDGKQIKLLVDHGFTGADDPALKELESLDLPVQGLVFRVPRTRCAAQAIGEADARAKSMGMRAQIHIRLADDSPAVSHLDPAQAEQRILETAFCAAFHRDANIYIDTLCDVDRGYFPRAGLVDRRYNPRAGAQALRNLHGALSEEQAFETLAWRHTPTGWIGWARVGQTVWALVLPSDSVPVPSASVLSELSDDALLLGVMDLRSGQEAPSLPELLTRPTLLSFSVTAPPQALPV